jgi:hypothetical protein
MKMRRTIIAAAACVSAAPSAAAAPAPPAALQSYIHDGHFDPGDYGWLRGMYPDASAPEQAAFKDILDWQNACRADSQERARRELKAMGIDNPSLDNLPVTDTICSEVNYPLPTKFESFADLQRAAAEARSYADTYLFALRTALREGKRRGSVAEELLGSVIPDQMARASWGEGRWKEAPRLSSAAQTMLNVRLVGAMADVDHENTAFLKWVVDQHGWPTISRDGSSAAANAWLLVQHADADPPFQLKALRLMQPLLAKGEVDKANYALLYDRVMVNIGQKQIYGTQMTCSGGKLVPHPIEDEANLAKRRADMGLPPMAEYLKLLAGLRSSCSF